jgi:hypothetical protein
VKVKLYFIGVKKYAIEASWKFIPRFKTRHIGGRIMKKNSFAYIACVTLIVAGVFFTTNRAEARVFSEPSNTGCAAPIGGDALGGCGGLDSKENTVTTPTTHRHHHYHHHYRYHFHFHFHRHYHPHHVFHHHHH